MQTEARSWLLALPANNEEARRRPEEYKKDARTKEGRPRVKTAQRVSKTVCR